MDNLSYVLANYDSEELTEARRRAETAARAANNAYQALLDAQVRYDELADIASSYQDTLESLAKQIEAADYCPGCGCRPGDGITESCDDLDGCGYLKEQRDLYRMGG